MIKNDLNNILENNQIPLALFALYLLISSNYLGELFTCSLRKHLTNNMVTKHILAIITLYISVIMTTDIDGLKHKILATVVVYIWFLLTTKCTASYVFIILLIISLTFILNKYIDSLVKKDSKNKKKYEKWNANIRKCSFIISIFITIIGFVLYYIKKKKEYGNLFQLKTFIFGVQKCAHE